MFSKRGPYDRAGAWLILSGLLHFKFVFVMGFNSTASLHMGIGILWFLSGLGFMRGWRWLVWLLYLPVIADAVFTMALSMSTMGFMAWWYGAIAVIDVFAVIAMFMALWRTAQAS